MYLSSNSSQTTKNLGNSKTNEIIFSHIFLFKHDSDVLMRSKLSNSSVEILNQNSLQILGFPLSAHNQVSHKYGISLIRALLQVYVKSS